MDIAYTAVGRAVLATQMLETALVPILEMHRLHAEPGRLTETGGYLSAGAFKVPVSNIVKLLVEKGAIAPDLEERLNAYVQDRHLLIHRWIQERGLPDERSPKDFLLLAEFAVRVEREARELTRMLVGYVVKHGEPTWAEANPEEHSRRMAELFQRAHRESNE